MSSSKARTFSAYANEESNKESNKEINQCKKQRVTRPILIPVLQTIPIPQTVQFSFYDNGSSNNETATSLAEKLKSKLRAKKSTIFFSASTNENHIKKWLATYDSNFRVVDLQQLQELENFKNCQGIVSYNKQTNTLVSYEGEQERNFSVWDLDTSFDKVEVLTKTPYYESLLFSFRHKKYLASKFQNGKISIQDTSSGMELENVDNIQCSLKELVESEAVRIGLFYNDERIGKSRYQYTGISRVGVYHQKHTNQKFLIVKLHNDTLEIWNWDLNCVKRLKNCNHDTYIAPNHRNFITDEKRDELIVLDFNQVTIWCLKTFKHSVVTNIVSAPKSVCFLNENIFIVLGKKETSVHHRNGDHICFFDFSGADILLVSQSKNLLFALDQMKKHIDVDSIKISNDEKQVQLSTIPFINNPFNENCTTMSFLDSETQTQLLVGDVKGNLFVFDLNQRKVTFQKKSAHSDCITSISV